MSQSDLENITSLREFFDKTGVTQTFIAKKVRITPAHLSQIVNGEVEPRLKLAIRLSDATGVPVRNLLPKKEEIA